MKEVGKRAVWTGQMDVSCWIKQPLDQTQTSASPVGKWRVLLPPFLRKLATPSKRNPSLQGGRSFFHQRWQKDPPAVFGCRLLCTPEGGLIFVALGASEETKETSCQGFGHKFHGKNADGLEFCFKPWIVLETAALEIRPMSERVGGPSLSWRMGHRPTFGSGDSRTVHGNKGEPSLSFFPGENT